MMLSRFLCYCIVTMLCWMTLVPLLVQATTVSTLDMRRLQSDKDDAQQDSHNNKTEPHHHLVALDHLRNATTTTITRAGIVDRIVVTGQQQGQDVLGLCHIATIIAFTFWLPSGQRIQGDFTPVTLGGLAAAHLAMDMLNRGDGSVVAEVEGLHEHCPLRFTMEAIDSSFNPPLTSETTIQLLQRQTPADREICSFLGAMTSAETIPMAILTGLQQRPQLSPFSTSSQLDDRETFPFFGRLIESDDEAGLSLILYLQQRNVAHVGIVHWDDDYGNAYVRSIQQRAAQDYPELVVVSATIPTHGATKTEKDWEGAVEILARTRFRYFVVLGDKEDYHGIMHYAYKRGIAGTGKHVWIVKSSSLFWYFDGLIAEKGSPEALTARGTGLFSAQNGRPGMPVFDKFAAKWKMLDNEQDLAFLQAQVPQYTDLTGDEIPQFTSGVFQIDPSVFASTLFDETIMLGLSACQAQAAAAAAAADKETIHVDGQSMFENILTASFQGATGNVTIDPKTGSRLSETAVHRITNVVQEDYNETHVIFRVQDSDIFLGGKWIELIPFVFSDGTSRVPPGLPESNIEYHYIGSELRAMGVAMTAFIVLTSLAFAGWTISRRNVHIVRASQPIFLLILCMGATILGLAIVPLSIDDEIASNTVCNAACVTAPWLASVGFALIFSALGAKTWRVNRIFHTEMLRIKLSALDVMFPLFALTLANLVVLTVWTAVSPLEWTRSESATDMFGRTIESRGQCKSDDSLAFLLILGFFDLGALLLASYQSYEARGIATEFAESDYIGRAMMCMLLVSCVGVPTMIIVSDDPKARFFALSSIIFVLCSSVLLFIFVPKISYSTKGRFNVTRAVTRSLHHCPSTDTGDNEELTDESYGLKILNQPFTTRNLRRDNEKLRKRLEEMEKEMNELKAPLKEICRTAEGQEQAVLSGDDAA